MAIPVNASGERIAANGAVILGPNQFALLAGLFDRPDYLARSSRDFHRAALPYAWIFRFAPRVGALEKSTQRMLDAWVTARRKGRCLTWRLTPRGVKLVQGTVPAHIHGVGPYEGMAALRQRTIVMNRVVSVHFRWGRACADESKATLVREVDALVECWCRRNSYGNAMRGRMGDATAVLRYYARWYALAYGEVPRGIHKLTRKLHGSDCRFVL